MPVREKAVNETLRGIVLREIDWKERDKLLTVLTREHGRLFVAAHGVKSMKHKDFAVCQPFAYSELVLTKRGDRWTLREGMLLESFFDLRKNLGALCFAHYACEVCGEVSPEEMEDDTGILPHLLNALYIAQYRENISHIKAVFEMRLCCLAGFRPELSRCTCCGRRYPSPAGERREPGGVPQELGQKESGERWRFDCLGGGLLCPLCEEEKAKEERFFARQKGERYYPSPSRIPLDESCLAALRFVCGAEDKRIFSFSIAERSAPAFFYLCERFLLDQLERGFKSLEFYHEMFLPGVKQGMPPPEVKL